MRMWNDCGVDVLLTVHDLARRWSCTTGEAQAICDCADRPDFTLTDGGYLYTASSVEDMERVIGAELAARRFTDAAGKYLRYIADDVAREVFLCG